MRDGSGTYSLPQAAFTSGTTIESAKVNSDFSDIASALTQSVSKDGQTTMTGSLPMGGFKLTGLGVGTGTGESIRYDEFKYLMRSHLAGLQCTSRTTTTVVISAGTFTEDGQTAVFSHAGGTINCATTGALGLDAGSLANNTWYHAFAIAKADGTTSLLASTSVSSPTFPTGYTLKRRLFSFKTNGSAQIIDFIQDGDNFWWLAPVSDANSTNPGTSAVTRTLTVPTGVNVLAYIQVGYTSADTGTSSYSLTTDLSSTDTTPNSATSDTGNALAAAGGAAAPYAVKYVRTNTSAQVRHRISFSNAGVQIQINTLGWIDRRGRDA
jgi:hypothetical protein